MIARGVGELKRGRMKILVCNRGDKDVKILSGIAMGVAEQQTKYEKKNTIETNINPWEWGE